jgi:methylmalonyl-CoA mutase
VLGEGGLPVSELAPALEGVYLDLAPVALDAGAQTAEAATALLQLAAERRVPPAELAGTLGADPIGLRARTGDAADLGLLGALAAQTRAHPDLRVATVDATVYAEAGAGDAVELAIATSVGVAYLRALAAAGSQLDEALDAIEFRFAVSAEQFASIAKLRAARRLWGRVAQLCGASSQGRGQRQHAVTSAAMLTQRDPWVNMLRTTIACFAAAVGGADAITVLPFDAAIGVSDDFARRIARNTHAVLHDESSLARVVDPAGGSWYVESFTDALAQQAWQWFTEIERAGGAGQALDDGVLDELVAVARDPREADIRHRRVPITGVSEFAFPDEQPVVRPPVPARATGGRLQPRRYAAPFEELRTRAEAAQPRPAVFLATLGPPSTHSARLAFATNLFQAGGVRVISGPPEQFGASGTTVACLCGSDKIYAEQAASALQAMSAGKFIWLAGAPRELDGVDGCLYAGCDALDVLATTFDALGVAR